MLKTKTQILKYIIGDYLTALATWLIVNYISTESHIINIFQIEYSSFYNKFFFGIIFLPVFWVVLYYLTGQYHSPYYRSRLQELGYTIMTSIVGNTLIFFFFILNNYVETYKEYYFSIMLLTSVHFILSYIPRLFITTRMIHSLRSGKIYFNTIFIGGGQKAVRFYNELKNKKASSGHRILGFVSIVENSVCEAEQILSKLGNIKDLKSIIKEKNIHEVIISSEQTAPEYIEELIAQIEYLDIKIRLIPDLKSILIGKKIVTGLYGSPLLEITHDLLPVWQQNVKRIMDISLSILAMLIGIPLYIFLTIGVKLSSKGPILYSQERIGRYGKRFKIFKFRSMCVGAEKDGPELSSNNDPRITQFGKFMRKSRLDEIPQFYNVIKGDMSLVGPRPERQFYIDQITKQVPHFNHLLMIRPGITSWGQVKFGYAENVEQMIERLKYDLIYIENMSIYFDIKILIYTLKIIFERSGK